MKPQFLKEDADFLHVHDGKGALRVHKTSVSKETADRIRAMAPKKMSGVGDPAEQMVDAPGGWGYPAEAPVNVTTSGNPIATQQAVQAALARGDVQAAIARGDANAQIAAEDYERQFGGRPTGGPSPATQQDPWTNGAMSPGAPMRVGPDGEITQPAIAGLTKKPVKSTENTPPPGAPKSAELSAAPKPTGMADPYAKDIDKATADMVAGKQAEVEAAAHQGRQEAAQLIGRQQEMERQAADTKAMQDRAAIRSNDAMTKWQHQMDENSKIDATVDPGHFWASRSIVGKLASIASLALGVVGNRNGENPAVPILQQAIDRDLEAQKAQFNFKMKKGEAAAEGLKSYYSMARDQFGDEIAADAAAKAATKEAAANRMELVVAQNKDPQSKAQGAQFIGALKQSAAKDKQAAHARMLELGMQQQTEQAKLGLEKRRLDIEEKKAGLTKGGTGAGAQAQLDEYEAALNNPLDPELGDDREAAALAIINSTKRMRPTPENVEMISGMLPGRFKGARDRVTGSKSVHEEIEKVKRFAQRMADGLIGQSIGQEGD